MVNRFRERKPVSEEQVAKLWKALEKYGIYNEEQFNEAFKNFEPLNITCMVAPVPKRDEVVG